MKSLFDTSGKWFKGNLHTHTTISDGRMTPQEAAELYRKADYDFLALTDHWTEGKTTQEKDFLLLNGCEFDTGDMIHYPIFHIIGIGMKETVEMKKAASRPPQEIVDAIHKAGGIAILAHPAWSVTSPEETMKLNGISGAEIYNSVSGVPWNARPESGIYFDVWASNGKIVPCMAADDCHFYEGEQTKSYIMVNAEKLAEKEIMKSLKEGNFYASQGPRFISVEYDDNTVQVTCSESKYVIFYSNTVWCKDRVAKGKVTSAEYQIKPTDRYVRIELIDESGNHAWCSPFIVNENRSC